jgi:hypothetical protein
MSYETLDIYKPESNPDLLAAIAQSDHIWLGIHMIYNRHTLQVDQLQQEHKDMLYGINMLRNALVAPSIRGKTSVKVEARQSVILVEEIQHFDKSTGQLKPEILAHYLRFMPELEFANNVFFIPSMADDSAPYVPGDYWQDFADPSLSSDQIYAARNRFAWSKFKVFLERLELYDLLLIGGYFVETDYPPTEAGMPYGCAGIAYRNLREHVIPTRGLYNISIEEDVPSAELIRFHREIRKDRRLR